MLATIFHNNIKGPTSFAEVSSLDKGKNKFLSIMEHWQLILYYWNIPIAILYFSQLLLLLVNYINTIVKSLIYSTFLSSIQKLFYTLFLNPYILFSHLYFQFPQFQLCYESYHQYTLNRVLCIFF